MTRVTIGDRVFDVRNQMAADLISLLEHGMRFREIKDENIYLHKLVAALEAKLKRKVKRSKR